MKAIFQSEELRFVERTMKAFRFLESLYGFVGRQISPFVIRYESASCVIRITRERGIVDVTLQPTVHAKSSESSHLSEVNLIHIVRSLSPSNNDVVLTARTNSEESYFSLAATLAAYTEMFLRGNFNAWAQLEAYVSQLVSQDEERRLQEAKESEIDRIKAEAYDAWKTREYARMITLYSSIQQFLTPAEKQKLEYGRKHLRFP